MRAARALRFGVALAAALATGLCRADDPDPCDEAGASPVGPYTITCAGKSECVPSDHLEIKPADPGAPPLASACLRFVDVATPPVKRLPLHPSSGKTAEASSYPLSPLIERWLRDPKVDAAFRAAPRARQVVNAILVDASGRRFKAELLFDLSPLWASGALRLEITKVECNPCKLGGWLTLTVPDLETWKVATKSDPTALSLVMAGNKMPGIAPLVNTTDGTLSFPLRRAPERPENATAWTNVLDRVLGQGSNFKVGLSDDKGGLVIAEQEAQFGVSDHRVLYVVGGLALVVLLVGVIGWQMRWTFLRDDYDVPEEVVPAETMPFSLGRSQMIFWTIVIVVTWACVGWSTGDWLSLNESSLALMGIGIGTAAGSMAAAPARVGQLVDAYTDAKKAAAAAPEGSDAHGLLKAAEDALRREITAKSWYRDVMSDYGEGAGLHRLQSVLFTLLFGGYFTVQAVIHGTMPVLSPVHMAMLGISSSAYIGFKYVGK